MSYNAADRRQIRKAEKAQKIDEHNRGVVVSQIASTEGGRRYLWEKLGEAHIFDTTFNDEPGRMAFLEGQRSMGLSLLNDIIQWCPEQYIQMMKEANVRRISSDTTAPAERSSDEDTGRDVEGPTGSTRGGYDVGYIEDDATVN